MKKRSHSVGELQVSDNHMSGVDPESDLMKTFAKIRGAEKQRNLSLIEEVEEKDSIRWDMAV